MIRSGLTNQRRGGGFESGYTHQRDNTPRDEIVRPYVDGFDTGFGALSDPKQIIPKPVSYTQIFSKRVTPDERLYLLKMAQQGARVQNTLIGRTKTAMMPAIEPPALPTTQDNDGVPNMIGKTTDSSSFPGITDVTTEADSFPGITDVTTEADSFPGITDVTDPAPSLSDYLTAQDVVDPPVHESSFAENDRYVENWITGINGVVRHSGHNSDDVTPVRPVSVGFKSPAESFRTASEGDSFYTAFGNIYPTINDYIKNWPFSRVETNEVLTADEEVKSLSSELEANLSGLVKSMENLAKGAVGPTATDFFTKAEKEKIKFAANVLKRYEELTPEERKRFLNTLSQTQIRNVMDMVEFVDAVGNEGYARDNTLAETMYNEMVSLPANQNPRYYLGKIVEINGVGPRQRGPLRATKKVKPIKKNVRKPVPESPNDMNVELSVKPVEAFRRRRVNPPHPIKTNVGASGYGNTPGIADAYLNPGRTFRSASRAARPQVLEDAIRQKGLDVTRRPRPKK